MVLGLAGAFALTSSRPPAQRAGRFQPRASEAVRPMPWVANGPRHIPRPGRSREISPRRSSSALEAPAALQAASCGGASVDPGRRPDGLSPGLGSPDPLGRWAALLFFRTGAAAAEAVVVVLLADVIALRRAAITAIPAIYHCSTAVRVAATNDGVCRRAHYQRN